MAKAYIQSLQNRDGDAVYPVTTSDAVYLQKTDSDGVITQQTLTTKLESMETSFQDGVDTIVAALTELGVTPESTTPAGIAAAIKTMYSDRYKAGYDVGVETGHAEVIADPGAYGLITQDEYDAYGVEKYEAGIKYADSRVNTSSSSYTQGYHDGKYGATLSVTLENYLYATATQKHGHANAQVRKMTITLENGVLTLYGLLRVHCSDGDGSDDDGSAESTTTYNID